uniref:Uncharacterized protein n=2 Tax=Oryza sativa subsp. japonica TaxID=39947 RepID=Q7F189_ORYSJ|nr:hypothetical protein [Oryza sativa Japonica Group]BAC83247.1 hypothetical protein [Oryza sativa Japonica Group]
MISLPNLSPNGTPPHCLPPSSPHVPNPNRRPPPLLILVRSVARADLAHPHRQRRLPRRSQRLRRNTHARAAPPPIESPPPPISLVPVFQFSRVFLELNIPNSP